MKALKSLSESITCNELVNHVRWINYEPGNCTRYAFMIVSMEGAPRSVTGMFGCSDGADYFMVTDITSGNGKCMPVHRSFDVFWGDIASHLGRNEVDSKALVPLFNAIAKEEF